MLTGRYASKTSRLHQESLRELHFEATVTRFERTGRKIPARRPASPAGQAPRAKKPGGAPITGFGAKKMCICTEIRGFSTFCAFPEGFSRHFTIFAAFCWPPHLSPGRAAAAEESPRETRLGPLSEPLFAAFSRDFTRNGRFLRPFPGILREMSGPPRSSVTRRPGAPRQKTGGRPDHRFWSQKNVHLYIDTWV